MQEYHQNDRLWLEQEDLGNAYRKEKFEKRCSPFWFFLANQGLERWYEKERKKRSNIKEKRGFRGLKCGVEYISNKFCRSREERGGSKNVWPVVSGFGWKISCLI